MNEAPAESDRFRSRAVRVCYIAFYVLGLPLFFLTLIVIPLTWHFWPHRADGVMEGPEPTDGEVIGLDAALGAFAIAYLVVFFTAHRFELRRAWLPLAVQLPALLLLVALRLCWSADTWVARLWVSAYPALLSSLLLAGILFVARAHRLNDRNG